MAFELSETVLCLDRPLDRSVAVGIDLVIGTLLETFSFGFLNLFCRVRPLSVGRMFSLSTDFKNSYLLKNIDTVMACDNGREHVIFILHGMLLRSHICHPFSSILFYKL